MYYNYSYNYPSPEQINTLIRKKKKHEMRKTLSGLGFAVFSAEMFFIVLSVILQILISADILRYGSFFTENLYAIAEFWHGITLFTALFGVGMFYCFFSNTKLSDILKFKKVSNINIFAYTLFGIGVAYIANILTGLFLNNISVIGIENAVGMTDIEYNDLTFIVSTFITAVTPAFAEEFLFRGVILGKLRQFGDGYAVLISSLLFGFMHCNFGQIPFAFIGGAIFGFVTVKTNSMLPAMIIHGLNNFLSCFVNEIATSSNSYIAGFIPVLIFTIILLLGILGFIILTKYDKNLFTVKNKYENKYFNFNMKEKVGLFFSNIGTIFALVILTLETISSTTFTWFA